MHYDANPDLQPMSILRPMVQGHTHAVNHILKDEIPRDELVKVTFQTRIKSLLTRDG